MSAQADVNTTDSSNLQLEGLCSKLQHARHTRSAEIVPYRNTEALKVRYTEMPFDLRQEINNNGGLRIIEQKIVANRRGLYPEIETLIIMSRSGQSKSGSTRVVTAD